MSEDNQTVSYAETIREISGWLASIDFSRDVVGAMTTASITTLATALQERMQQEPEYQPDTMDDEQLAALMDSLSIQQLLFVREYATIAMTDRADTEGIH